MLLHSALRVSHLRHLRDAIEDEQRSEQLRRKTLACCVLKATYTRVLRQQDMERSRAREYLGRMQHDNEAMWPAGHALSSLFIGVVIN